MKFSSQEIMNKTERFGAHNYHPLPIVIQQAEGVWVTDPDGHRYMDMLSGYSALNQGHRHPRIIAALKQQADEVTLTSRAFYNAPLAELMELLSGFTGKQMVLPMNTGAEAVETAVKAARRWGYEVKGISYNQAEIIVCEGNFHGRTTTITSFSSDPYYQKDFGPFTPGFRIIPYGDMTALTSAINQNTAAFLVEPIQGEAGIQIPPEGYLTEVRRLCSEQNVLLMADEIQTGFGRTGRRFACDWEQVVPDIYIMGKALGGGVLPVSAVAADESILGLFEPGSHGSTFGGNPLASRVAIEALKVTEDEKLADRSFVLGNRMLHRLKQITSKDIKEVRGRGLFIGIELRTPARPYCERLMQQGLLCKETHDTVIRFAPPLIITDQELEWAIQRIEQVFT
ncbi:ornithine--oxo-acid transaminase [Paenibacillus urinalis]|uniref:Ornithine aminotransferase n=1 Tax=Paenibacillus urinalis TaxID=521520 RepID=A0ABY7XE64_9BACL|nr:MULTISPECIES: ornithine--oxo-acid transaminase [Paenibacillus]WDH95853.1 ornithine--oxo-acid transaminase [Paenibacillus urinalis]WDI04070.1 ornithine--oxo-acid transaminase [Paenibacillus urinalis]GAK38617.1 ornithine--oxo-acid transaminase [Paenibacillus sp. TCA20]